MNKERSVRWYQPRRWAMVVIRAYQRAVSPLLGRNCRYYPTCSSYSLQAIEHHGFVRGAWMGTRRIARCHPFHEGGYDPVPGIPMRGDVS